MTDWEDETVLKIEPKKEKEAKMEWEEERSKPLWAM